MKASNYIAGQWVEGTGSIRNINPSDTSEIIDEYTSCTDEQFEQSIRSAATAQREWETVGIEKKSQVLIKIGDELIQKSKQIGELLSREEGKPLNEDEDYWVAAPNFVTQGGDGYWEFKNSIEYIDSGVLIVDAAENFLREKKIYEPKYEGRVKAIEQGAGDGI